MAKQTINLGTGELAGDGESIRTAFNKINRNFDETYADISNLQSNAFSGSYNDLTNKPVLFSGSYNDLTDTPVFFDGDYNSLTNKPVLFSGSYNDLSDTPTLFDGDYASLTNKPDLTQYVSKAEFDTGTITIDVNNTGDLQGSVFADDSTLLVDAVNGIIPGNVIQGFLESESFGALSTVGGGVRTTYRADGIDSVASLQIRSGQSGTAAGGIELTVETPGTYTVSVNTHLTPNAVGVHNLGLSGARWNEINAQSLNLYAGDGTAGISITDTSITFPDATVQSTAWTGNTPGLSYSEGVDPGDPTQVALTADIFDFGTGNIVDLQGNSVLFNGATVQNFAPGDIYAKNGQYLYIVSIHDGGSATNANFIYDTDINNVRQTFYGKTIFANNGQAPIVDFTGATITGTSFLTSEQHGNFTLSNNTITTNNGDTGIDLVINGATSDDPPALVNRAWRFVNDGSLEFRNPFDFGSEVKATITSTKVGNWDTAHGWGDHSAAGYLTSVPSDITVNSVTTSSLTVTGVGTSTIQSGNNIVLDAVNRVLINDTPFRLAQLTTTERNSIASPENGDMIYNTTTQTTQSYENGSWASQINSLGGTFTGNVSFNAGVYEQFNNKTNATGVIVHDLSTGHIFNHALMTADFTPNLTNIDTTALTATSVVLFITQQATAYMPTALQIDGVTQTINWQGGAQPVGTANGVDVVTFSIMIFGPGSYTVLGQSVSFS